MFVEKFLKIKIKITNGLATAPVRDAHPCALDELGRGLGIRCPVDQQALLQGGVDQGPALGFIPAAAAAAAILLLQQQGHIPSNQSIKN